MTITTADCDAWRAGYATMSLAQHQAFYSAIWAEYPRQSHFNADALGVEIEARKPGTVVELGGWDGEAAGLMLDRFPSVMRWWNVEVCAEAVSQGLQHERYTAVCPGEWYWDRPWRADLFVASHTIEHLTAEDLERVIAVTTAKALYLDAPLLEHPANWWGSPTTHIIEVGWQGIDEICRSYGYEPATRRTHQLEARSGGFSTVSVYEATA